MAKLSEQIGGGGNYLRAADLPGRRDIEVTIDRMDRELVGKEGQEQDEKWVLYFRGKEKGLVMNQTNLRAMIDALGDKEPGEYAEGKIIIYRTRTDFRGEMVDCIRVRPVAEVTEEDLPF